MTPDMHKSDVINAKIYFEDGDKIINAVTSEESGRVRLFKYKKLEGIIGYKCKTEFLFKDRLKGPAAISILRNRK